MLVLDEADEMLNQGFKEQIYDVYRYLPPETQVKLQIQTRFDNNCSCERSQALIVGTDSVLVTAVSCKLFSFEGVHDAEVVEYATIKNG